MAELSQDSIAIASKRLQSSLKLVETALAATPLDVLSKAIDKDDGQTSKIRSGQLGAQVKDVVRLIHASGLKCVSADKVCVDRDTYQALAHIASKAMANKTMSHQLVWEDESE